MTELRVKRKQWIQRGKYAVVVEEVYPADASEEACLEPATVRRLEEIALHAAYGDVDDLLGVGQVYQAVEV